MDPFHHPKLQQTNTKKRLTQEQVQVLETSFDARRKLVPELKSDLARRLGVPPRQVAVWYQNRRARWKSQSLELDHTALLTKLEGAAAEKRRLEREVARLSHELSEAHEMLLVFMSGPPPPPPPPPPPTTTTNQQVIERDWSCSSFSDQWGSSGVEEDGNGGGGGVLQLDDDDDDELYASFMAGGGGSTSSWIS